MGSEINCSVLHSATQLCSFTNYKHRCIPLQVDIAYTKFEKKINVECIFEEEKRGVGRKKTKRGKRRGQQRGKVEELKSFQLYLL